MRTIASRFDLTDPAELQEALCCFAVKFDEMEQALKGAEEEAASLRAQLAVIRRQKFAPSSEKSPYNGKTLFDLTEETARWAQAQGFCGPAPAPPEETTVVAAHTRRRSPRRELLPDNLPRVVHDCPLTEDELRCPECGEKRMEIGVQCKEQLTIIPAAAHVDVYVTHTCKCPHCEKEEGNAQIETSAAPPMPLPGSFASAETLAWLLTEKFQLGLPLYRIEETLRILGIQLSRQTLSTWVIKCADLLKPVYQTLHQELLRESVLHADETPLTVLHEPDRPAQSRSYVFLYRTGIAAVRPVVLYDYRMSRSGKGPQEFLEGFQGWLHVDGYQGYESLPDTVRLVGCFAHARRKFHDALQQLPPDAREGSLPEAGVRFCNAVFAAERDCKGWSPKRRKKYLRSRLRRLLKKFRRWLRVHAAAAGKTNFGKAVSYTLRQFEKLSRCIEHGRLSVSNNLAERSIKAVVMGRKAWLFCNTPDGAHAAMIISSIIQTAKANHLIPYEYLLWLLKEIPRLSKEDPAWTHKLLPWHAPDEIRQPLSTGSS